MQLGRHLRELWRLRLGLAAAIALSALAALWSVGTISLAPPGIEPRKLELAAASTRVLVDAQTSSVLDLSVPAYDFDSITNRALLVGNVMASEPVRDYIGARAGVEPELLQVASPITPEFPRPLASSGKKSTSDILKSPEEFRLSIQVNPTAPIVDVYAEAPTAEAAGQLANGAVDGMKDYLSDLGAQQGIPLRRQVRLEQLGRAEGEVLNGGVSAKLALLTFLLVLGVSSVALLFLVRLREGWRAESRRDAADPWPAVHPTGPA